MVKCAVCGRKLSNITSIAMGIGPECRGNSSGSKPVKNWKRRVINSANIKHGKGFYIGTGKNKLWIGENNFDTLKQWLIKYQFILKDNEISNEILDKIFEDQEKFFTGGINEEKTK